MSILKQDLSALRDDARKDLNKLLKESGYVLNKFGNLERDVFSLVEKRWVGWLTCLVVGFIIGWLAT